MHESHLIGLFELSELSALLEKTGQLLSQFGCAHSTLQWSPAPAPLSTMQRNSLVIWDNFEDQFGDAAPLLVEDISRAIEFGLASMRRETLIRQNWMVRKSGPFKLVDDSGEKHPLTYYELGLVSKYGSANWVESFLCPVSRERDRVLFLMTRTAGPVSSDMDTGVRRILLAFWYAYHCLYITSVTGDAPSQEEAISQPLSSREIECLHWLAAGKTISESAIILGISERTLRFHVNNARERLGVATTTQAIVAATLKHGFHTSDARKSVYKISRQA